jgi:hypothetical protein
MGGVKWPKEYGSMWSIQTRVCQFYCDFMLHKESFNIKVEHCFCFHNILYAKVGRQNFMCDEGIRWWNLRVKMRGPSIYLP